VVKRALNNPFGLRNLWRKIVHVDFFVGLFFFPLVLPLFGIFCGKGGAKKKKGMLCCLLSIILWIPLTLLGFVWNIMMGKYINSPSGIIFTMFVFWPTIFWMSTQVWIHGDEWMEITKKHILLEWQIRKTVLFSQWYALS
jgi:hypothetical protein